MILKCRTLSGKAGLRRACRRVPGQSVKGAQAYGSKEGSTAKTKMQGGKVVKNVGSGSAWLAQLVEHLILGFSSGRDFTVVGLSPRQDLHSVWSLLQILDPTLFLCLSNK